MGFPVSRNISDAADKTRNAKRHSLVRSTELRHEKNYLLSELDATAYTPKVAQDIPSMA